MNRLMYMLSYGGAYGMGGAFRGMIVFFAVIAALISLAQLLWGYKLLRFWIAVQGFGIGGVIGSLIALVINMKVRGGAGVVIGFMIILICAVLGAFLAYTLYKVGVFLQCFACGFMVAMALFGILFRSMGLGVVLGIVGGIALGVVGVILTKPMFIITTSICGGLNCGLALGTIFGSTAVGIVLSLGLIGLGLWYQITHNNGLFELPGQANPTTANLPGTTAAGAAAAGMAGQSSSVQPPSMQPSSVQLPPVDWRMQRILIGVGIAAAATLVLLLIRGRASVIFSSSRGLFSGLLWAAAVTGGAGFIWRGNFSRESSGGDTKEQLLGIAVSAVPTIVVGMVIWQLYYTPLLYRIFGFTGIVQGFLAALKMVLLYMVPVVTLGVLWRQSVPSPLLYRPEREDINRMLMGAAVAGGIMAGIHVITVLGTLMFTRAHFSFRTFIYLFCYILCDAVTAAAMTYVWGRRGIYRDTEEDRAPVRPAAGAAAAAGQNRSAMVPPVQGTPVFNAGLMTPAQQPVQTSKFRRKITVGMIKAENTQEYWREGAPLALTQMTLTEQAGQLSLTLGLQNLGREAVSAIYLDIDCYNVLKEKVEQLKDVAFLDLKVGRGKIFYNSVPVRIPDATVRQCEICLRHVVYADETIWNGDEGQFLEKLEAQKYLADGEKLGAELADEFCRIMAGNQNKGLADMKRLYLYAPEQREGFWYCSCGQINLSGEDICSACGIDRDEMFAMLSPDFLTQVREERLAEERRRQEEEERLKAERIAERNRKIEETKAAAKKKAQELVSQGKNYCEKVQGYVSGIGAGASKDSGAEDAGAMRICPNCKTICQPGTLFCISCGTSLAQPAAEPENNVKQPAPKTWPAGNETGSGVNPPETDAVPETAAVSKTAAVPETAAVSKTAAVPETAAVSKTAAVSETTAAPETAAAALKPCPVCKTMCGAEDAFCINCGADLKQEAPQTKLCPNCGRENKATAKFCIGCGTKLGD